MLTSAHIKAALAGLAVIFLLGVGWTARGWQEGAKETARLEAEAGHRKLMTELANTVATKTEHAIQEIKVENRTVYVEGQKEVIREPVYRDCKLTPDGVRNANQARRGPAAGKPDNRVPGSPAAP